MLSKRAIEEFKQIYKKEFKQEVTDTEAQEMGMRLLNFFKLLIDIDRRNKNS